MVKEAYCLSDRFCPLSLVGGAGLRVPGLAGVELGYRVASDCPRSWDSASGPRRLVPVASRPAYSCRKARIGRGTWLCLNLNKTINPLITK